MMREATIRIPHQQLEGFCVGDFVSLCLDAGLRNLTELACQSDGCLFVASLDSELYDKELDEHPEIEWWEQLSSKEDRVTYLCKISVSEKSERMDAFQTHLLSSNEITVDESGLDVSIIGTQDALSRNIDGYEDLGIQVALRSIRDYEGPRKSLDRLTERQRTIIETAFEMGYFEMPRKSSAADVADELELNPSTVTEHLRRAERNIISELLSE